MSLHFRLTFLHNISKIWKCVLQFWSILTMCDAVYGKSQCASRPAFTSSHTYNWTAYQQATEVGLHEHRAVRNFQIGILLENKFEKVFKLKARVRFFKINGEKVKCNY